MEELDPELQAMALIATTLKNLDAESQSRVLQWAAAKFDVALVAKNRIKSVDNDIDTTQNNGNNTNSNKSFADFVDLFDAVNPTSNLDKALTGAYWLQVIQGAPSWNSREVNNNLKDTGNGINSIVDAFDSAQNKNPALVRQMAKSGKTKQARKTFKLTSAGIRYIAAKIGVDTSDAVFDMSEDASD